MRGPAGGEVIRRRRPRALPPRALLGALLAAAMALTGCGLGTPPVGQGQAPAPSTRVSPAEPRSPAAQVSPSGSAPSGSAPSGSAPSGSAHASRVLTLGMSGPDVLQLQRRLTVLRYSPGVIDGRFGQDTLEAVWAFQEVQGIAVTGNVGPVTRRALTAPRAPRALVPEGGRSRVEVSLSDAVLVVYRAGQVALVSHVSSGGGYSYCSPSGCGYAATPTGNFATTAFMPGWVSVPLGEMYNPVFFIGTLYAIHGAADVPLRPVSHGCIRIPVHIAEFFHELVAIPGEPVYVRR